MSTFVTVLLEFEGECMAFSAGMVAFGGKVVAVHFGDAMAELEVLRERLLREQIETF